MKVFSIIFAAWGRSLGLFSCLGEGFWHHFSVLVEVFGIMPLSRMHLSAENRIETCFGTSGSPSGVGWGGSCEGLGDLWGLHLGCLFEFSDRFLDVLFGGAVRL